MDKPDVEFRGMLGNSQGIASSYFEIFIFKWEIVVSHMLRIYWDCFQYKTSGPEVYVLSCCPEIHSVNVLSSVALFSVLSLSVFSFLFQKMHTYLYFNAM